MRKKKSWRVTSVVLSPSRTFLLSRLDVCRHWPAVLKTTRRVIISIKAPTFLAPYISCGVDHRRRWCRHRSGGRSVRRWTIKDDVRTSSSVRYIGTGHSRPVVKAIPQDRRGLMQLLARHLCPRSVISPSYLSRLIAWARLLFPTYTARTIRAHVAEYLHSFVLIESIRRDKI